MVYVVSLQRVQETTNVQVRRLSAITRQLQACANNIVYRAVTPTGEGDMRIGSGYRRLSGDIDDEVIGYGIRWANLLRRGTTRLLVRLSSIVSARTASLTACRFARAIRQKTLAAARNLDD
eukprot:1650949-Pyramimonas_sp.AAC.1